MKRALITGASGGLGAAITRRLAMDGYEVWIHYLSGKDAAKALLDDIEGQGGSGHLLSFDVCDPLSVEQELGSHLEEHGPLDILVNNAGATSNSYMMMTAEDDWNSVMSVNLNGFFFVTKCCLKGMVHKKAGRVINIGSLAGEKGNIGQVAYAASKAGLTGATRALALEMARWNILVNAVSPGPLEVGMAAELDVEKLKEQIPLRRLGRAEEVAGVVSFLCSNDATYLTGQTISVNGGMGM